LSSHRVLASLLDYSIILLHAGGHWRTGNWPWWQCDRDGI
jgi:hypothetical protein